MPGSPLVAQTPRLLLRRFTEDDAAFVLRQLNEPSWLANIGDRGVRSLEEAKRYLREKVVAPYGEHGFGMYLLEARETGVPVGMCGLVRRDALPDADIGFALLEEQQGRGYAEEVARAVVGHAFADLGLARLLGIVKPSNQRSARLLQKLGFEPRGTVRMGQVDLLLYAAEGPTTGQPVDGS